MARPPGGTKNTQYAGATDERVKRGLSWLTRIDPNWLDSVSLSTFDNRSSYRNALGQIYAAMQVDRRPGFMLARMACDQGDLNPMSRYALSDMEAIERGFECVWDTPNQVKEEDALNRRWIAAMVKLKGINTRWMLGEVR